MFEHQNFKVHTYDNIPLNEDCFVMDEKYLKEYEEMMIALFNDGEYEPIGLVSYAAVRKVNKFSIELSWYPNVYDRFHEVSINIPKMNLLYVLNVGNRLINHAYSLKVSGMKIFILKHILFFLI